MAKALYEKRQFTNMRSGEIIQYDFYGIVGIVNGKAREMRFKDLDEAQKLAFETIAAGDDPVSTEGLETYHMSGGEVEVGKKPAEQIEVTGGDDDWQDLKDAVKLDQK